MDYLYIPLDIFRLIASFSTSLTVDQLRSTCHYFRHAIPKIHYAIPTRSYDETMNIIDDIAAKKINQPLSIKFHALVRKITKDPTELVTKLANINNLTSINLSVLTTLCYSQIQPLIASRQILDLGITVTDDRIVDLSPQLTKLVWRTRSAKSALAKTTNLKDLTCFRLDEITDIHPLPNPAALTRLYCSVIRVRGKIQDFMQFANLKELNISSIQPNYKIHSLALPNLENLCINMSLDFKSILRSPNLTSLELQGHAPANISCISSLTNLQNLRLEITSERDQRQLTCLRHLQIKSIRLTGTKSTPLVNQLNPDSLVRLHLLLPYDSPHLNDLTKLTGLETLYLESPTTRRHTSCPRFFVDVSNLTRLTRLEIFTPQMLCNRWDNLTTLQHVFLCNRFLPRGSIGALKNLTYLYVTARKIDDYDQISALTKLESFVWPKLKVKNDMLLPLTNLTNLRVAQITSADQVQLPKLKTLEILRPLGPDLFLSFKVLTTLHTLMVGSSVATDLVKQGHPFVAMTNLQNIIAHNAIDDKIAFTELLSNTLPLLCTTGFSY